MRRRSFLGSLAVAPAAGLIHFPCGLVTEAQAQQPGSRWQADPFKPVEPVNSPMGVSRAIHPGRVAWVRDAKAASWDTTTGKWWDDANTDQRAVDRMTSRLLRDVTGRKNDKQAWDALFRSFNETHKSGGSGYRPGETIAIKVNANQDRGPDWANMPRSGGPAFNGMLSPHIIMALVTQLIEAGGVRGEDIILYDVTSTRNIGLPIYNKIRANSNPNFQAVKFLVASDYGQGGRISPTPDTANPIQFAKPEIPLAYLPRQVTEAKYMINLALMRAHGLAGVTLIGKNHFGSVYFPNDGGWSPRLLHNHVARTQPMGSYNALVDLMGHRHLGGKTMLYLFDALYTADQNEGNVIRWQSFGDQWASSMMMSQDPVALESVGLDLLRSEPRIVEVRGNVDNYMHEAAQASKPPSGTVYNPDKTGALASLGVHEHWNNSTGKQYSRNLGRKEGIELIASV